MRDSKNMIVASYRNTDDADRAIQELRRMDSLSDKQVGLLVRDDDNKTRFKSLKDVHSSGDNKAGTGAAAGAAAGAGGGALWALGIAAGALPAIGPVVGGGLLGAILASAGTGAVAGGVAGSLIGLGLSDEDAEFASREIESGSTVVVVKDAANRAEVLRALEMHQPTMAPSARTGRTPSTDYQPRM